MPVAAPADRRFRRTQAKPVRRRRGVLLRMLHAARVIASFVCFAWGVYLLGQQVAHARSLHVDRIVVRGNARVPTREVLDRLRGLRGEHVLNVDLEHWRHQVLLSPWVEYAAIRRVLPSPLIDRLILRATRSASANTRNKFPPSILRMSCSLYPRLSSS